MLADKHTILTEIGKLIAGRVCPVPGARIVKHDSDIHSHHCMSMPILGFTVQGRKYIRAGEYEFSLKPGTLMATCVDMPSTATIIGATPARPFLSIVIDLNTQIITELLPDLPNPGRNGQGEYPTSFWIMETRPNMLGAFLRLARLMHQPDYVPVLGPMIIREIHFLCLISPIGAILSQLYRHGGRDHQILEVMTWLKSHLEQTVVIEDLARRANMSVSSFHRHFKTLTGITPLQYHKSLRLYEAQRLMMTEDMRVSEASAAVGYESVAQFNREYRRMFGAPPRRDIHERMKKLTEIGAGTNLI